VKKKRKINGDKKLNKKREKDNKMLSQKNENGVGETLYKRQ
jgi:hypothetical protein